MLTTPCVKTVLDRKYSNHFWNEHTKKCKRIQINFLESFHKLTFCKHGLLLLLLLLLPLSFTFIGLVIFHTVGILHRYFIGDSFTTNEDHKTFYD